MSRERFGRPRSGAADAMPFLVFGIRRPLRGLTNIARCIPGFRFAPPGAIPPPLRGLILFTVMRAPDSSQHSITPTAQVEVVGKSVLLVRKFD